MINIYESIKTFIMYGFIVITGLRIFHIAVEFISNFKVHHIFISTELASFLHDGHAEQRKGE